MLKQKASMDKSWPSLPKRKTSSHLWISLDQQVKQRQAADEEVMKTQNLLEELEDVHEGNEAVNKPTMKEKKYDKDGLSITDDEHGEEEKKEDEVPLPPKKKRKFVASPEGKKQLTKKQKRALASLQPYNLPKKK